MIRRHRWSVLSLVVTVGTWLALGGYTQYQYRYHHITNFSHLSPIGGCAVVISRQAAEAAGLSLDGEQLHEAPVKGRREPVQFYALKTLAELQV